MSRRPVHVLALILIIALAAVLRLAALEQRPPHHDEGVNGWFTEKVVKDGYYRYDPSNYHGPSYFYALLAAREGLGFGLWQLRLPGALFGLAMCFTPLLLRRRLGWGTALAACGLLAASPTLVYFSRYAIHETLLAGLGLLVTACALRWADRGSAGWLIGGAAALAGMIATKETTIIFLAISGLWLVGETVVESWRRRRFTVLGRAARWSWRVPVVALAMLAVMATIHVLFFTGFLQQPGKVSSQLWRSLDAFFLWKKTGTGHRSGHEKEWCYYIHLGVRYELILYALAFAGLVAGFRERWVRGPALVGFGMVIAYSLIAYKMPWLPASWLALLALPAAHGVTVLARVLAEEVHRRIGYAGAVVIALVPALAITARSSFVRPADKIEQLAYVHTDADYNTWYGLIQEGAARLGDANITIAVDHDATWPLPYSLTPYPKTRWGATGDEDVIIVAVSRAGALDAKLSRLYLRRQYMLRDSAEPAFIYLRRSLYARILGRHGISKQFSVVGNGTGPAPSPSPAAVAAR